MGEEEEEEKCKRKCSTIEVFFYNFGECFSFFFLSNSSDFQSLLVLFGFCCCCDFIRPFLFFALLLLLLLFGISGFGWRLGHPRSSKISIDCWMTQGNWCWRDLSSFFVCLCLWMCVLFCFLVMSFDLCFLHPLYSPWVFSWSTQNTEFNLHQQRVMNSLNSSVMCQWELSWKVLRDKR